MQKFPYVFPIVGGRKIEHLHANLEALEISLSPEQIKFLGDVVPFDKGFPYSFFVRILLCLSSMESKSKFNVILREMARTTIDSIRLLDTSINGPCLKQFVLLPTEEDMIKYF